MKKPILYILSGMSFAGKSVLAKKISSVKAISIIGPDEISAERGLGLRGDFIPEKIWKNINNEAQRRAKKILQQAKSLIYDSIALNRQQRDDLRNIAQKYGAEPIVIIVDIRKKDAYERWNKNNDVMHRHAIHIDDFNMCADGFEFPKEDEDYLVYKAGEDIDKWIKEKIAS